MNTAYFLNCIAGNVFGSKTEPALPEVYYIGLSKTAPDENGDVVEPSSALGYSRVALTVLSEPVDGVVSNTENVSFAESIGDWGTVTHYVIFDAPTGGNLLMYEALGTSRNVEADTIITLPTGSLVLSIENIA